MGNKNYLNYTMDLLSRSRQEFILALKNGFGFQKINLKQEPSDEEINRFFNQADKLKAVFERRLKPEFNKWQTETINLFLKQMAEGASILTLNQELKEDLNILLTNHWLAVAEAFVPGTSFVKLKQGEQPVDGPGDGEEENDSLLIPIILDDIENDMLDAIKQNSPSHTSQIIETTEQIGNNAKSLSQGDLFEADAIMKTKMAARSTAVSVTETNWPSQTSQDIAIEQITPIMIVATESELKALQPVSPNVRLKTTDINKLFAIGAASEIDLFRRRLSNPQKMWVTMGDKRVRRTHNLVNGTTVGLNEPFRLVGGLMQFPTDGSLGVSFREIIGCRCHLFYF